MLSSCRNADTMADLVRESEDNSIELLTRCIVQ